MRAPAGYFASLLLIAGAAAWPAFAQPAPSAEERAQLDWVGARGQLLFDLDRAAWVATDDMLARIPNAARSGLRGYIVERAGAGYAVTFFGGEADAPTALYRGRVENRAVVDREVFPADARPPLSAAQRRLAAARNMGAQLGRRPCGQAPFNTVVIPPETEAGAIDLYLLTPQTRNREWPLGGHFRATLNADGSVASNRAFTNTCLMLAAPPQVAALVVSHLLDPLPTEIHVFSSLTSGLPVFVRTGNPDRMWSVTGTRIAPVAPPRGRPGA